MGLGIVARCDNTGLGNQTRELVEMLNPDKVLLINSKRFNNNDQFPEWYDKYKVTETNGFPKSPEIKDFLRGLTTVLTCETFYFNGFIDLARQRKIKTILQYNYEFLDYLANDRLSFPDVLLSPSPWFFEEVKKQFGNKSDVIHLPPPTNHYTFAKNKEFNMSKDHKRILHIAGKSAAKDRNGTNTVIDMLKYSKEDYELVVRTQSDLEIKTRDSRLKIEFDNVKNREDMYYGFDAMVLPRRYAGLCLPMNEALLSGMPVFMTDISPNNKILPNNWLVDSDKIDRLKTRTMLHVYEANAKSLAGSIDNYIKNDKQKEKELAYDIGYNNFSAEVLKDKYLNII